MSDKVFRRNLRDDLGSMAEGDAVVAKLLSASIGRIVGLLSHDPDVCRSPAPVSAAFGDRQGDVRHVLDWLRGAVMGNAPWLENVDADGHPKKLLKCRTLDDLVREADRDMRRLSSRMHVLSGDDGEEVVGVLPEGWSLVRLTTAASLDRETARMGHCIGNGAYDASLSDGQTRFLSLRDPRGYPHATMEIRGEKLIQMQGKQNRIPLDRYLRMVLPLIREWRLNCNEAWAGLVTDEEGRTHLDTELPAHLSIGPGDVRIVSTPDRPIRLPRVVEARDKLYLAGNFPEMPDRIVTAGDLHILSFVLRDGTRILPTAELPSSIRVGGGLSIRNHPAKSLPDDIRVRGELDLYGTPITSIPRSLRCGSIDISHTSVKVFDTEVFETDEDHDRAALPPVADRARGPRTLVAVDTPLERIEGTPRFGTLDLSRSAISELPRGLYVAGDLVLDHTTVGQIGADVRVDGSLRAATAGPLRLPEFLDVGVRVHFDHCDLRFAREFSCGASVLCRFGRILEMPDVMRVGSMNLRRSMFHRLPETIRARELVIAKTGLRELGGDVEVETLVVDMGLRRLGEDVRVSGCVELEPEHLQQVWAEVSEEQARGMIASEGCVDFPGVPVTDLPKMADRNLPSQGLLPRARV